MSYFHVHCSKKRGSLSARGNHTIAVVNGTEKYETLQVSFKNAFSEINYLIEQGAITLIFAYSYGT